MSYNEHNRDQKGNQHTGGCGCVSSQMVRFVFTLLILCLTCYTHTEARVHTGTSLECNPRQVKMRCIMGCFGCFKAFGVEMYDMAACCRDCRLSEADLIDDGPTHCSHSYIKSSWLKRFG